MSLNLISVIRGPKRRVSIFLRSGLGRQDFRTDVYRSKILPDHTVFLA